MHFTYNGLFKKLDESKIKIMDFRKECHIGGTTWNALRRNESVSTDTILKICEYFKCTPCDIMEFHAE